MIRSRSQSPIKAAGTRLPGRSAFSGSSSHQIVEKAQWTIPPERRAIAGTVNPLYTASSRNSSLTTAVFGTPSPKQRVHSEGIDDSQIWGEELSAETTKFLQDEQAALEMADVDQSHDSFLQYHAGLHPVVTSAVDENLGLEGYPPEVRALLLRVYGHTIRQYQETIVSLSDRLRAAEANLAIERRARIEFSEVLRKVKDQHRHDSSMLLLMQQKAAAEASSKAAVADHAKVCLEALRLAVECIDNDDDPRLHVVEAADQAIQLNLICNNPIFRGRSKSGASATTSPLSPRTPSSTQHMSSARSRSSSHYSQQTGDSRSGAARSLNGGGDPFASAGGKNPYVYNPITMDALMAQKKKVVKSGSIPLLHRVEHKRVSKASRDDNSGDFSSQYDQQWQYGENGSGGQGYEQEHEDEQDGQYRYGMNGGSESIQRPLINDLEAQRMLLDAQEKADAERERLMSPSPDHAPPSDSEAGEPTVSTTATSTKRNLSNLSNKVSAIPPPLPASARPAATPRSRTPVSTLSRGKSPGPGSRSTTPTSALSRSTTPTTTPVTPRSSTTSVRTAITPASESRRSTTPSNSDTRRVKTPQKTSSTTAAVKQSPAKKPGTSEPSPSSASSRSRSNTTSSLLSSFPESKPGSKNSPSTGKRSSGPVVLGGKKTSTTAVAENDGNVSSGVSVTSSNVSSTAQTPLSSTAPSSVESVSTVSDKALRTTAETTGSMSVSSLESTSAVSMLSTGTSPISTPTQPAKSLSRDNIPVAPPADNDYSSPSPAISVTQRAMQRQQPITTSSSTSPMLTSVGRNDLSPPSLSGLSVESHQSSQQTQSQSQDSQPAYTTPAQSQSATVSSQSEDAEARSKSVERSSNASPGRVSVPSEYEGVAYTDLPPEERRRRIRERASSRSSNISNLSASTESPMTMSSTTVGSETSVPKSDGITRVAQEMRSRTTSVSDLPQQRSRTTSVVTEVPAARTVSSAAIASTTSATPKTTENSTPVVPVSESTQTTSHLTVTSTETLSPGHNTPSTPMNSGARTATTGADPHDRPTSASVSDSARRQTSSTHSPSVGTVSTEALVKPSSLPSSMTSRTEQPVKSVAESPAKKPSNTASVPAPSVVAQPDPVVTPQPAGVQVVEKPAVSEPKPTISDAVKADETTTVKNPFSPSMLNKVLTRFITRDPTTIDVPVASASDPRPAVVAPPSSTARPITAAVNTAVPTSTPTPAPMASPVVPPVTVSVPSTSTSSPPTPDTKDFDKVSYTELPAEERMRRIRERATSRVKKLMDTTSSPVTSEPSSPVSSPINSVAKSVESAGASPPQSPERNEPHNPEKDVHVNPFFQAALQAKKLQKSLSKPRTSSVDYNEA